MTTIKVTVPVKTKAEVFEEARLMAEAFKRADKQAIKGGWPIYGPLALPQLLLLGVAI